MTHETETTINGWQIRLTEIDQYNDYSVKFDYRLEVIEPGQRFGRTWELGTDHAKASAAYLAALRLVSQHVARGQS